jgi:predicted nuclease of predicted toxin-antitoxin system
VRFLADESCDFAVVTALRAARHDISAVVELEPGAEDAVVLALARSEGRILLPEDKDFGMLAYAGGHETAGVVLIRFPANARSSLGQAAAGEPIAEFGDDVHDSGFAVIEPGRARLSRPGKI